MTKVIPVNGHVLVELPKDTSGIFIPESLSDSQQEGVVVSRAEDIKPELLKQLNAGVVVRWEKFAEADGDFELDGKKLVLIKAMQIMGVIESDT